MSHLPDLEAWAIFAKVAELGSFARAADALKLSKPTVSKAISRLEARLRIPLLHRTSRQVTLTENGRAALVHAQRILSEGLMVEAESLAQADEPRGVVRMTAPMSFGVQQLAPLLPGFMARYPDIRIDLHLSDAQEDLVARGYDLALRIASLQDSTLRVRTLCPVARPIVAAPSYLERFGRPQHPQDLLQHRAFHYTLAPRPELWQLRHKKLGTWEGRVPGCMMTNNADVIVPALVAGLGIAIQPIFAVWDELQRGSLEEILPDWGREPISLYLVTPPGTERPSRVRLLIDYLAEHLAHPRWAMD